MAEKLNEHTAEIAVLKDHKKQSDEASKILREDVKALDKLIRDSVIRLGDKMDEGLLHMANNITAAYGKYVKMDVYKKLEERLKNLEIEMKKNTEFRNRVFGGMAILGFIGITNIVLLFTK